MTPDEFREYIGLVRTVSPSVPRILHEEVVVYDGVGTLGAMLTRQEHARLRDKHEINEDARVLLYGYTTERFTFAVAVDEWDIIRYIDTHEPLYETSQDWEASALRPNKRAYPERTDINFALLMAERNEEITFTTFR